MVLVACARSTSAPGAVAPGALADGAITVGSFDFPESVVLAEIYAEALESKGFHVIRTFQIGTREIVDPSLERGLIELIPEYAGSALEFLGAAGVPGVGSAAPTAAADSAAVHDALVRAFEPRGVTVLAASPAQDQNGFAVTQQTATRYGLQRLSDLAGIAGTITLGGPPECPSRPLCQPGLEQTYGLHFQRFLPLDTSGPVTTQALRTGAVGVALMFTTDGDIQTNGFVLLRDDRHLQPAENVTPIVHSEVVRRFGAGVVGVIDEVSARLTTEALRSLNAELATGMSARRAASAWLAANAPGGPE
jgi:osmoprotectant transport system substrate-binding protein